MPTFRHSQQVAQIDMLTWIGGAAGCFATGRWLPCSSNRF
jgi:hypothetical protein